MTPEKEKEIVRNTPNLFYNKSRDLSDLPINLFGIDCEDGWASLIRESLEKIDKIASKSGYPTRVVQIKEKYGELRIYLDTETDEMSEICLQATLSSRKVCEMCGNPGVLKEKNRWYYTSCEDCDLKPK
jgi:Archaeal TRASH domain